MSKTMTLLLLGMLPLASVHAGEFEAKDGWREIAPSVYQRTNADGTIERASVGRAGAAYERQRLAERIERLKWDRDLSFQDSDASAQQAAELQKLVDAIDGAPITPRVLSSQTGPICQPNGYGYTYKFDADLSVSSTNATLSGRTTADTTDDFGPPLSQPTSGTFGVHVTINRSLVAPVDQVVTRSLQNVGYDADGNPSLATTISSSSPTPQVRPYPFCTSAEVFTQLSLSGGECPAGGDFRSWDKLYPTCTP
jgi:hypothetical protein